MDKKINLSQLADLLAQQGGMTKGASEQFVKVFFEIISSKVLEEGLVKVKGFGSFKLLQMEDRESINVNTGERFIIEGHQKISFSPDTELKERINRPFEAFEIVEITEEQANELVEVETSSAAEPATDNESGSSETVETQQENVTSEEISKKGEESQEEITRKEEIIQPQVRDITQKGITRFFLRFLVWLFSLLLVLTVGLYLLWPIVGDRLTDTINRYFPNINPVQVFDKKSTPQVNTQPRSIRTTVNETAISSSKETEVVMNRETAVEPLTGIVNADTNTVQQPVVVNAATAYDSVQTIVLCKEDQEKKLGLFTESDTVNFRIIGRLAEHKIQNGETMVKLAFRYYGTKKLWPYIAKYNKIKGVNDLAIGQIIYIPRLDAK